jgi:hypothetical protein
VAAESGPAEINRLTSSEALAGMVLSAHGNLESVAEPHGIARIGAEIDRVLDPS